MILVFQNILGTKKLIKDPWKTAKVSTNFTKMAFLQ